LSEQSDGVPETFLTELTTSTPALRVDRAAGVIYGVSVLGNQSRNDRTYTPRAMADGRRLAEGVKVRFGHKRGTTERDFIEGFGVLRNLRGDESRNFADLHFAREHPWSNLVCEFAERFPDKFGLSHNAEGTTDLKGGKLVVESLSRIPSVDIVDDPATNRGLFESIEHKAREPKVTVTYGKRQPAPIAEEKVDASKLTDRDRSLGRSAEKAKAAGRNPDAWVADESKWEKAKAAVDENWDTYEEPWAIVAHVYRQMGGGIKESIGLGAVARSLPDTDGRKTVLLEMLGEMGMADSPEGETVASPRTEQQIEDAVLGLLGQYARDSTEYDETMRKIGALMRGLHRIRKVTKPAAKPDQTGDTTMAATTESKTETKPDQKPAEQPTTSAGTPAVAGGGGSSAIGTIDGATAALIESMHVRQQASDKKIAELTTRCEFLEARDSVRRLLEANGREATEPRIAALVALPTDQIRRVVVAGWPVRDDERRMPRPARSGSILESAGVGGQSSSRVAKVFG
jgi:hypothetical protein